MKTRQIIYWASRIVASLIMLQTLYFKFTASPESVYIFTTVGMEPWGRIGLGIFELVASVLILVPSLVWLGSLIALGLMAGAIGMHATLLGIEVMGDGGQLFLYAVIVALCSAYAFWQSRATIPLMIKRFLPLFLQ